MYKKAPAILMIFIAYAILFGHSIIPHHHHDDAADLNEHHHSLQHDHGSGDEGLSHLLSHFIHSDDGFTFSVPHNNTFSKQPLSLVALMPDYFRFEELLIPSLPGKPPAEQVIYISPHSHPTGLRAPPAAII